MNKEREQTVAEPIVGEKKRTAMVRYIAIMFAVAFVLVVLSTFLYPLANRKVLVYLESTGAQISAAQMVLGLTLGSLPFWALLSVWGGLSGPGPTPQQWGYTFVVALLAGVAGTTGGTRPTGVQAAGGKCSGNTRPSPPSVCRTAPEAAAPAPRAE